MYGEPAFRDVERRIIARLLREPVCVLATGGGAFMDIDTRGLIAEHGLSLWLRADLDVLAARTARRGNRPLLKEGETREVLRRLIAVRYPAFPRPTPVRERRDGPPGKQ